MKQEKFNIKKFFNFSPVTFYKAIGISIRIAILVLLILAISGSVHYVYRIFFPKEIANINQPIYHVEAGGTVNSSVIQNKENNYEIGVFAGPIYYDDELGVFGGISFKRKF